MTKRWQVIVVKTISQWLGEQSRDWNKFQCRLGDPNTTDSVVNDVAQDDDTVVLSLRDGTRITIKITVSSTFNGGK